MLQAVATGRASGLDTKVWEKQDACDQDLENAARICLNFGSREKPFGLIRLNPHPAESVRYFLSSALDSQL